MRASWLFTGAVLASIPILAGTTRRNDGQYAAFRQPLDDEQRIQQAIDRLTFGPRPGDSAQVQQEGLKRWIDLQLHPERIAENPELTQVLAPLASLRLSSREIYLQYPPPGMIKAIADGKPISTDDPEMRAILQQLAERYRERKPGQIEKFEPVSFTGLLDPDQVRLLKSGTNAQKEDVLASIPPDKRLSFVLALHPDMRRRLLAIAPADLRRELMLSLNPDGVVADDLAEAKILRAAYSNRQLEEVLADFWFNHFNVFLQKGADRYLVTSYERDVIRPRVFGKFYDLLLATAQSPAMLFYLDNAESVAPDSPGARGKKRGLNENYGRELLELHTLGVDGGYTQKDVTEVARCFTGWTITGPAKGSEFHFNERLHDEGVKIVLGHRIHAGGMRDGIEVLKLLAKSPVTAHHICLQLAQRFVADDPPPSIVDRMTKTYLKKDGDLREVLRTMLHSPEFWSQGAYEAKIKTPLEFVVSALRASHANVQSAFALNGELQKMGEPLYRKIEPTGYSFANAEWLSSAALLERLNFVANLAHNGIPGVTVASNTDPEPLAAPAFQKH